MLPRQEVPQPPAIHSTLPLNPAYLSHLRPSMSSGSTGRGLAADTFGVFCFFFNSTCCLSFHPHFMGPSTALHIPRWMWVLPRHSWGGTVVGRSVGGSSLPRGVLARCILEARAGSLVSGLMAFAASGKQGLSLVRREFF